MLAGVDGEHGLYTSRHPFQIGCRQFSPHFDGAAVQNRVGLYTTQVHDGLQQANLRGKLLPNTALSEATISSVIEVSRTPVREDWLLTDFFCQSVCTDPLVTVPGVP